VAMSLVGLLLDSLGRFRLFLRCSVRVDALFRLVRA